ncbi:hypothetical protein ACFX14_040604 [Malus domestica]
MSSSCSPTNKARTRQATKVPTPRGAVYSSQECPQAIFLPKYSFGTPDGTLSCMPRRRKKKQTFKEGAKQKSLHYTSRSSITNLPEDLQGPILTKSPTSSEKSERKVTKEDL